MSIRGCGRSAWLSGSRDAPDVHAERDARPGRVLGSTITALLSGQLVRAHHRGTLLAACALRTLKTASDSPLDAWPRSAMVCAASQRAARRQWKQPGGAGERATAAGEVAMVSGELASHDISRAEAHAPEYERLTSMRSTATRHGELRRASVRESRERVSGALRATWARRVAERAFTFAPARRDLVATAGIASYRSVTTAIDRHWRYRSRRSWTTRRRS